ncbi:MAG TPA: hypothetical protein VH600_07455 [Burkholderiales bacterium]|jgi:hypothetical protein
MRFFLLLCALWLSACSEPPHVGITISNSPEPIENCGSKIGPC